MNLIFLKEQCATEAQQGVKWQRLHKKKKKKIGRVKFVISDAAPDVVGVLTLVRGVWEKREKPSNRYSWSSYSITVGLSV